MTMTSAAPIRSLSAWPWQDRAGRLSLMKLAVFVGLFLPALWIIVRWRLSWLGAKPVTEALHQAGLWSVRFLALTLAVTPLRFIGNWPKLFLVRRMLGLASLAYVLLHITLYLVQEAYDVSKVLWEIVLRFYLTIGAVALIGLIALGATSTDAMIKRMGALWHRLHRVVYLIVALALVHFFIQSKIDVTEAVLMAGLFGLLMIYRLMRRFAVAYGAVSLAAAALLGGVLTMLVEALWYGLATGVPGLAVLKANLDFSYMVRPGWWVLAAGLAIAILKFARPSAQPRRRAESAAQI